MTLTFRIQPDYHGPSLIDLLPILDGLKEGQVIEAAWAGTRYDFATLERVNWRPLVLVVPDQETQERTLWRLGAPLELPQAELEGYRQMLSTQTHHAAWRSKLQAMGYDRGALLLCKLMASSLLAGKRPRPSTVAIARDTLLNHTHPVDADLFMRLRSKLAR